jgi:hypothetical protein
MLGRNVETAAVVGNADMYPIEGNRFPFTASALLFIRVRDVLVFSSGKHQRTVPFAGTAPALTPVPPLSVLYSDGIAGFDLSKRYDSERVRVRNGI